MKIVVGCKVPGVPGRKYYSLARKAKAVWHRVEKAPAGSRDKDFREGMKMRIKGMPYDAMSWEGTREKE